MKNSKFGFTLAETLITLSIIGIIAALLIPQLAVNANRRMLGVNLGKSVYLTELACQKTISDYNDGSSFSFLNKILLIPNWQSLMIVNMNVTSANSIYSFVNLDSEFKMTASNPANAQKLLPGTTAATIEIDPNGYAKRPADVYTFNLNNSCKMIPANNATETVVKNGFKIQ